MRDGSDVITVNDLGWIIATIIAAATLDLDAERRALAIESIANRLDDIAGPKPATVRGDALKQIAHEILHIGPMLGRDA